MSDQKVDDFLAHHGVKGMKWGVRRTASQLRSARRERKDQAYQRLRDKETARLKGVAAKYKPKALTGSNAELRSEYLTLQKRINRLDMDRVVQGLGSAAKNPPRVNKLADKRGDRTPYQNLSAAEKHAIESQIANGTKLTKLGKKALTGLVVGGAVYAGMDQVMSRLPIAHKNLQEGRAATALLLVGTVGKQTINDVVSVNQAVNYTRFTNRKSEIEAELARRERAKGS